MHVLREMEKHHENMFYFLIVLEMWQVEYGIATGPAHILSMAQVEANILSSEYQVYCNTLQHTATHCNTLQHTAVF